MNIFNKTDENVKELLTDLVANLDYYGVESFKRQLTEYAAGKRSTNIGDAMCCTLGRLKTALENQERYYARGYR